MASQQAGIAVQLIFPLCPLSEEIQLNVQPAAPSDSLRGEEKEREGRTASLLL